MGELEEFPTQLDVEKIIEPEKKKKPNFDTMKGLIQVVDPDWDRPQEDVEAWLKGDV